MIFPFLQKRLERQRERGMIRSLKVTEGLIDLTSNDYFGFAKQEDRIALENHSGATGSRLLTGNSTQYEELEEEIGKFHRGENSLIFNSGYCANVGLISSLGIDGTTFLYDLEIHASMIDGMGLTGGKRLPFRHNDLDSLEKRLKRVSPPVFVLVESIYSMSGDVAPLKEIAPLCSKYGAALIVDEAHATGIRGKNGEGLVAEWGLESQVFARVHTFSKALGAHGACVIGSSLLKKYLVNFARSLIYTTALPSSALGAIRSKYERLKKEAPIHQSRLRELNLYLSRKLGLELRESPIHPLFVSEKIHPLSEKLRKIGLDVRPIVPPTVPRGRECLRIVLHSFNQEEEIDRLAGAI